MGFENFEYFIHLITEQFYSEEAVIEFVTDAVAEMERRVVPSPTRMELNIQHHFGPRPS